LPIWSYRFIERGSPGFDGGFHGHVSRKVVYVKTVTGMTLSCDFRSPDDG